MVICQFISPWRHVVLVALLWLGVGASAADSSGWIPLFDGQSLAGWKAGGNPGGFKVVDGTIAFDGRRSHLFYDGKVCGADFKNFELKAEVHTKPLANSGIYFHTAYQEKDFPEQGFEVQVANTHVGAGGYVEMKKTGSLYGVRNVHRQLVKDNEWFALHISVRGNRIQVRLNDCLLYTSPSPRDS